MRLWCPELTQEGQWHHLVIVLHRAGIMKNSNISLFVDGELVASPKVKNNLKSRRMYYTIACSFLFLTPILFTFLGVKLLVKSFFNFKMIFNINLIYVEKYFHNAFDKRSYGCLKTILFVKNILIEMKICKQMSEIYFYVQSKIVTEFLFSSFTISHLILEEEGLQAQQRSHQYLPILAPHLSCAGSLACYGVKALVSCWRILSHLVL